MKQLLGALVATLAATGAASAAERNWTVEGRSLKIDTPCARTVEIQPASSLSNKVEISAIADNQDEIAPVTAGPEGGAATLQHSGECYHPTNQYGISSYHPTMVITIKVPAGFAIELEDHGAAGYRIGPVGGQLTASMHGSGNIDAVNGRDLRLSLHGSGHAHIGELTGKLEARISGSGGFEVGKLSATASEIALTGSGNVKVDEGNAGQVLASLRGSGDMVLPTVGALQVSISGSGNSETDKVTGPVEAKLSGSGDLSVHSLTSEKVALQSSGSAGVKLAAGTIGNLTMESTGHSDIDVGATVGDATVSVRGSGDIRLAKVTGKLMQDRGGSAHVTVGH